MEDDSVDMDDESIDVETLSLCRCRPDQSITAAMPYYMAKRVKQSPMSID
jgi:hypothetical protein